MRRRKQNKRHKLHLFQSTHSMRSATRDFLRIDDMGQTISIHALHAECDYAARLGYGHLRISIHALHAECDILPAFVLLKRNYFNPRTPCGVRRQINANLLKKFPLICITFRFRQTICNIYFHIWNYTYKIQVRKTQGFHVHLPFAPRLYHQNAFCFMTFFSSIMLHFCLISMSESIKPEAILRLINT